MLRTKTHGEEAHVKAIVMRSNTSFYWALRLLPREKRSAMFAIYAFCRVVDDIADELGTAEHKRLRLQKKRAEIVATFDGTPNTPVGRQLLLAKNRFELNSEDFLAIIEGMAMDVRDEKVEARVRIVSMDELTLYCDRVAGAVGRLSNRVFGLAGESGDRLASALGRALQLTNILRDLLEDAETDRLYLPQEMLKKYGIEKTDPEDVLASPQLAKVCDEIAIIAEQDFQEAEVLLSGFERDKIRPIIIMKNIYHSTLQRLIRRGWIDLEKPVHLSKMGKLWIIFCSEFSGR
jgi:squalene synthase HpnD